MSMHTEASYKPPKDDEETQYINLNNRLTDADGSTGEDGVNSNNQEDCDDEKKNVLQMKKEQYIQSFTVHGVSRVFDGTRGETSFWSLIVVIGIVITSVGVYNLITKYLAFEIYTALSSKITNTNPFPAITFCNNDLMMENYFSYCGSSKAKIQNSKLSCNFLPDDPPEITNILNTNDEWSNGLFHVKYCNTWGSRDCANDMYLKSLPRHNHACFTWNYNGNFSDTYAHAKLKFTFNESSGGGAIVATVHDHRISELELMHRVFLNTKHNYALNIRKSMIYRLPPPFPSKCTHGKPHDIFPGKYTRTTCVDSINYINMLKQCGDTIDYVKRRLPSHLLREYKHQRNLSIIETKVCMQSFSQRTVHSTDSCPVPCEELELMTMSTFHDAGQTGLYTVDIQLQDVDSYKVITEHQVFTWDQLAGGVGGFLGLMIGASLVSLIEIIVYVILCLVQKCLK